MVKRLIIACILIFNTIYPVYAQSADTEDKLTVHVSQTKKQLGQYFRINISYTGNMSLERLNLELWKQQFTIIHEDEYKDEDKYGRIIQTLKLRLYPRNKDISQLPSLTLEKAKSISIPLKVTPTKIKNEPIKLSWNISNLSPWQREAVIIRVRIQSTDTTAHVILDSADNNESMLRALKTEKHISKNGLAIFNAGWIYYPLNDGKQSLDLPAIRYQLSGSDRRRFYLPIQHLQVKPLPSYLPPNLPVGKLKLNTYIESGEVNSWITTINTPALIPFGVPGLDKQLSIINGQDLSNIKMKYAKLSAYKDFGELSVVNTPLPKWLMPLGSSININIRYFDPETGTLKKIQHTLPRYWNMPQWAWWFLFVISFFISIILIKTLQPLVLDYIGRFKQYKQIQKSNSAEHIRNAILNKGNYRSLSQWSGDNHARQLFANKLNKICFSVIDYNNIKNLQIEALKLI